VANPFIHWIEAQGPYAPWLFLALFILASFLMIWRLEAMGKSGFEGTVLGTLIMPYCSGMGNLIFAFILGRHHGSGEQVMVNSLVNNVTNMTLILGLPAIIFGIKVLPGNAKPGRNAGTKYELNRLSLLLTLMAVLFFTGAVWALGQKGELNFYDGLVLVGLFLFWQSFHIFEVLKSNVRTGKSLGWRLPLDLALLAAGAYVIYISTDWLVNWIQHRHTGYISDKYMGWLSGWVMVLPNATLAFYYSFRGQPETVYASQVGDSHVSIPLCIGIFTLFQSMSLPAFFHEGMLILLAATMVHLIFVLALGRLPRYAGLALVAAYGLFVWKGFLG
jgi:cation:H+ antiporter